MGDLKDWLKQRIAKALACEIAEVEDDLPFYELGLESLDIVEMSGELEDLLGQRIDPDILYEHSTIDALTKRLLTKETPAAGPGADLRRDHDIAIVGIGCRFPGASNVEAFWQMLIAGEDAIREVPADRWNIAEYFAPDSASPGKMNTKWGGFLTDVDGFDHAFFGISQTEAEAMDPQQRLLLEVCREAFEDAGQPLRNLRGEAVGVFIGISHNDYEGFHLHDLAAATQFSGSGNALSIAANRLSYQFDFRGPSLAVDTACSSALVAVHLAIKALRTQEARVAVAGGVNVLLSPEPTIVFSQAGMMSPDGRCKTFDARANGYVRGEGAGLVVLKRLQDALDDGDRIYAVLRGSATNQDGRSNGLNAPNPAAQEAVLRAAYADAAVEPATVAYVEAHGTGTKLGDPIEASALSRVVGAGAMRRGPCLIGSVKSNIGHLESAAGAAGLIKAALIAYHGVAPPSLHFVSANPHIPFENNGLLVPTTPTPLPPTGAIGVSAFGFGGTNCHVVLERPCVPPMDETQADGAGPALFTLSASSQGAFDALLRAWEARLSAPDAATVLHDLARSSAMERDHFKMRWMAVAETETELRAALADAAPTAFAGKAKIGWAFPGQGTQYPGMAALLSECFPIFAERLRSADGVLRPLIGCSLDEILSSDERLAMTAFAQPAIAAIQMAMVDLLTAVGVTPHGIVGHSVGEIAAAYAAGGLDFDEALRVAALRGRAMDGAGAEGAMLSVALAEPQLRTFIEDAGLQIDIAAMNSAESTVAAGRVPDVDQLIALLKAARIACRPLATAYAFHSRYVEEAAARVREELGGVAQRVARVPFYSTVTGERFEGPFDAAYWARNVRSPVNFVQAAASLLGSGCDLILELGPDTALTPHLRGARADGEPVRVFPLMKRGGDPRRAVLAAMGEAFRRGQDFDWKPLFPGRRNAVRAPGHVWGRETDLQAVRLRARDARRAGRRGAGHPILGMASTLPEGLPIWVWEKALDLDAEPWLGDHRVNGAVVMPAAAVLRWIQTAAEEARLAPGVRLTDLRIAKALVLDESATTSLIVRIEQAHGHDDWEAAILFRRQSGALEIYAQARIEALGEAAASNTTPPLGAARARCVEPLAADALYQRLGAVGLGYGSSFHMIDEVWRRDGEAIATLAEDAPHLAGGLHPGVLDAGLQLLAATLPGFWTQTSPWLPTGFGQVRFGPGRGARQIHAELVHYDDAEGRVTADVTITDAASDMVVQMVGVGLQRLTRQDSALMRQARLLAAHRVYADGWVVRPAPSLLAPRTQRILVLMDEADVGAPLLDGLRAHGCEVVVVHRTGGRNPMAGDIAINAEDNDALQRAVQAMTTRDGAFEHVLCLWPLELRDAGSCDLAGPLTRLAALMRTLAYFGGARAPRLWLVTEGACEVQGLGGAAAEQACVWGLGMAAAFEAPALRTTRFDLDATAASGVDRFAGLISLLQEDPADGDQFADRAGRILARRIEQRDVSLTRTTLRDDRAYVVTGGAGAIGLSLASGLADHGAGRVVLLGRRPADQVEPALAALRARQIAVDYIAVDVADAAGLANALDSVRRERPIAGVFHAAGHLDDGPLFDIDEAKARAVLAGKSIGAWNLHHQTLNDPVEHFVLFSSVAASVGSFGQGAYMAANAYLGGLAVARRELGRPALCVEWGPWADAGMAAQAVARHEGASAVAGVAMIEHGAGVEFLMGLLGTSHTRLMVLPYDLADLLHLYPDILGLSLFQGLLDAGFQRRRSQQARHRMAPRPALTEPYVEPTTELQSVIAGIWQRALMVEPIGIRDPFFELGGDSVFAEQVLSEINRALGVAIDPEAAFEELTVEHLARLADADLVAAVSNMSEEELERALVELESIEQPAT